MEVERPQTRAAAAAAPPAATRLPSDAEPECDEEVFDQLEAMVSGPAFLHTLETAQRDRPGVNPNYFELTQLPSTSGRAASAQPAAVAPASSSSSATSAAAAVVPQQRDEFEMVDQQDAVDALAYYLASCLMKMPEAQAMQPRQLQDALTVAMRSLRRSKVKRLCEWGRYVYRWSAFTYSAVQMYQNPWLIQALLTALWTFSKVARIAIRASGYL